MGNEALYDGPFVVTCYATACANSAVQEPGAPGPEDWLDISVWRGGHAESVAYFCSLTCLAASALAMSEQLGDDHPGVA